MNRLRKNIIDMELIKEIEDEDSWNELSGSEFIEIRGKFVPNPLITQLNTFKRLFYIMKMGINAPPNAEEFKKLSKPQQKQAEKKRKEDAKRQLKETEGFKGLIEGILSDIEDENSKTYVIEAKNLHNHKIVTDLFKEYIRDRSGIELYNAEFRILGKVLDIYTKVEAPAIQVIPIAIYV